TADGNYVLDEIRCDHLLARRVLRNLRIESMAALGHKRTLALQNGVSALPPIATGKADMRQWSCPLYPRKRTCAAQTVMSALGQKRTSRLIRSPRRRVRERGGHG